MKNYFFEVPTFSVQFPIFLGVTRFYTMLYGYNTLDYNKTTKIKYVQFNSKFLLFIILCLFDFKNVIKCFFLFF